MMVSQAKASPGGSCRRRKAVTDEGSRKNRLRNPLIRQPLRAATFPKGEGIATMIIEYDEFVAFFYQARTSAPVSVTRT